MSSTDRHTSPQKQTSRTQHRPHHHRAHRHHDAEDGDADKPTGMVTPLYMQQNGLKVLVRGRRKRKDDGALKRLAHWFVDNQIGLSVNLSALLFLTHASLPRARPYTRRFFTLSYPSETHPGQYGNGFDDAYLILYCLVLLTGLRASVMEYVLAPFAKWHGIERKKRITRFAEQGWLSIYATLSWGFGLVCESCELL